MANQKGSNAMDRKSILLSLTVLFLTSMLLAHGNEKHVMGTVTAIGGDSISVENSSHQVQIVQINSETKFTSGGNPSSIANVKVGDRVVVHAKPVGDKLEATEVKTGSETHHSVQKK